MAMTLEDAERDMKIRWLAKGVADERERLLNAETLASLQTLPGGVTEIPGIDEVLVSGVVRGWVDQFLGGPDGGPRVRG